MVWQEISIGVPHEYVEPISYLFSRYGRGLVMESDGPDRILLKTYLPANSRQRLARIEVGVKLVSIIEPLGDLTFKEVTEEGWQDAWKSHFNLLKIGRRLVIKPTWIDYQAKAGEVVIEIDPGMAFGTGYHPTTYTCLEAMEQMLKAGASVLDLGHWLRHPCNSGSASGRQQRGCHGHRPSGDPSRPAESPAHPHTEKCSPGPGQLAPSYGRSGAV